MMAFRSPGMRGLTRKVKRTRKNNNNIYVPSTTKMLELNKSYIKNRNESVRNNFNAMISAYGNSSITNEQSNARIRLARKMARGNRVSYMNKVNAGIVKPIPKPTGPKPTKGGRKTRRVYRK